MQKPTGHSEIANEHYEGGERRPIASRERKAWQLAARELAGRGIHPNTISLLGMVSGLLAGLALAGTARWPAGNRWLWLGSAALIQLRLVANMLDGMVAIESCKASRVGELYNEVPDRVSDTAIFVGAGYAAGGDAILGWAAACMAMFVAYIRVMGKAAGATHEFCGPMAKQHRMFVLSIVALYMAVVPGAYQPIWRPGGRWSVAAGGLGVVIVGGMATAIRRLARIGTALKGEP